MEIIDSSKSAYSELYNLFFLNIDFGYGSDYGMYEINIK